MKIIGEKWGEVGKWGKKKRTKKKGKNVEKIGLK